jgi:hypothetical protein
MHNHGTDAALIHAVDPGSDRLTRDDVIAIHRAHLDGRAWAQIARDHDTNRKNIQRIVQGRRWRDLHPTVSPHLYVTPDSSATLSAEEVEALMEDVFERARTYVAKTLAVRAQDRAA